MTYHAIILHIQCPREEENIFSLDLKENVAQVELTCFEQCDINYARAKTIYKTKMYVLF